MSGSGLLDDAMAKSGGKGWHLSMLDAITAMSQNEGSIEEPVSLNAFLGGACRKVDGMTKVTQLFDVQLSVPEFAPLGQLEAAMKDNQVQNLPAQIRPPCSLPPGCRMSLIVRNMEDGTFEVLKIFHFDDSISVKDARKLCVGEAYAPIFRPGLWAMKKAIVALLGRLPGYHVTWFSLTEKHSGLRRAQTSHWAPEDEDLLTGINFINENAPECDSKNEQYFWIRCNIRENSGTPIAGWPEAKVRIMAQNKSKGSSGAPLEHQFPLVTNSLKPFLAQTLLPILYPLMLNFAFMFLGWPGVGKTPAIIVMMLALGRYHHSRLDLSTPPGWRRAKSLDNFKHRVGQIHEGVFLDDPSRDKIELADLKSFVTAEESQTCHGRYTDVKLAKNCCRAYATNDIQEEDEPKNDDRISITTPEFLKLVRRTFPGDRPADVFAVLKRSVVWIFGLHALYLRLPSEQEDAPTHRIQVNDLHRDLLAEDHKVYYGKYKSGWMESPPDFEALVAEEQDLVETAMEEYKQHTKPQDYLKKANSDLEEVLLRNRALPELWVWSLHTSPSQDDSPVLPPVPTTVPKHNVLPKRLGTFSFPAPTKRALRQNAA